MAALRSAPRSTGMALACPCLPRAFEQSKANLRLIDGEELVDLVFQHYERFDSRYKGILPLRRVYVPELVVDEGD